MPHPDRHLLTVWNPSYQGGALGLHAEVLVAQHRAKSELGVWWGLVRSPNRLQPLPHLEEILALDDDIARRRDHGDELQLYLTDYRSLYVGDVTEVSKDPVGAGGEVPRYYTEKSLTCEAWFLLEDIRLLVGDDMPGTLLELSRLRNTRYHDKPVSIYGGMTELPLLVTRDDRARYFDLDERDAFTGGRPWVVADAERSGLGAVMQSLRDDLFGQRAWEALAPATRIFIATAEEIFRAHRHDPVFDFSPVLVEICKAVEVECRRIIPRLVVDAPPAIATMSINGTIVDLRESQTLTVGQIVRALAHESERTQWLTKAHGSRVQWLLGPGAAVLDELAAFRNPAAHESILRRAQAQDLRNRWLGIGGGGHFLELARLAEAFAGGH
jgi:hypothetical protein